MKNNNISVQTQRGESMIRRKQKKICLFFIILFSLFNKTHCMKSAMSKIKYTVRKVTEEIKTLSHDEKTKLIEQSAIYADPYKTTRFKRGYSGINKLITALGMLAQSQYDTARDTIDQATKEASDQPSQKPVKRFFSTCKEIKITIEALKQEH